MIGVSSSSRNFASLGRYLVVGRDKVDQGRVAWTSARNLPTDEPELAAKIMRATAAQNVRVSQPVYHVALSFDPRDRVDRQTMERVADSVLRELKLDQHQAIIVAHEDRAHPHLHILINRIHPETRRAWDRWQDYPAVQRVLREEERSLNLRTVAPSVDLSRDRQQADGVGAPTRDPPERNEDRERAPRHAMSKINADLGALERGQKAAEERFAAERDLTAAESRRGQLEASITREAQARTAFEASLAKAYRDPAAAANAFLRLAEHEGERQASVRMRESPEAFGQLIGADRGYFRRSNAQGVETSRDAAREAAGHGASLVAARREIQGLAVDRNRETPSLKSLHIDAIAVKELAKAQVDHARTRLVSLREAEKSAPRREQVELRLGHALRRLAPREFEALRATLSPERFSIAHRLRRMARDAVLGRDVGE